MSGLGGRETITIGELLAELEAEDPATRVLWSGTDLAPRPSMRSLGSWRGRYAEASIGSCADRVTAGELAQTLRRFVQIGCMIGWKGGEYEVTMDTPLWCDEPGCYTLNPILGTHVVYYQGERTILLVVPVAPTRG